MSPRSENGGGRRRSADTPATKDTPEPDLVAEAGPSDDIDLAEDARHPAEELLDGSLILEADGASPAVEDDDPEIAREIEEDPEVLLGMARRERDDYLDALRRLQADFENYRKRIQRQQEELAKRATEGLAGDLLPSLDAFDLAEAHLVGEENPSPEGLLQAAALLRDALTKAGLERVEDLGADFDPTAHDAVEHVEADGQEGPVVDAVLRPGYRWKGRVLRPAMVKVRG